mmetsp:Transcript_13912/g.31080  ORF Transcript_13912/g.31080 Transcript_13912/m.31080 type:complete len:357 (+) Transcript_13912:46-1116(+)
MWAPQHSAGSTSEMGLWPQGVEAMEEYGSPTVASSPMTSTPMSGMVGSYPSTPMAASPQPYGDAAAQACQLAPALEAQLKMISSRVQKLERSRGQISKDIADMLGDTKDLQKRSSIARDAVARKEIAVDASLIPARHSERIKETPPPMSLPRVPEEQPLVAKARMELPPGLAGRLPESLTVQSKEVAGEETWRIEWRIDNVKAKFKECVGRPLVSPHFEAGGLPELRLMVFPTLGLDISGLTMREQKTRYEARIAEGPLCGALKFKVVTNIGDKLVIKFNLFVGDIVQGPLEHNFADHVIHGVDFNNNWLEQMSHGSLVVGVEMLTVQGNEPSIATPGAVVERKQMSQEGAHCELT